MIQVGALDFPNRRFFGNRAEEFVRARRAQLEVRNSNVVNQLLTAQGFQFFMMDIERKPSVLIVEHFQSERSKDFVGFQQAFE